MVSSTDCWIWRGGLSNWRLKFGIRSPCPFGELACAGVPTRHSVLFIGAVLRVAE